MYGKMLSMLLPKVSEQTLHSLRSLLDDIDSDVKGIFDSSIIIKAFLKAIGCNPNRVKCDEEECWIPVLYEGKLRMMVIRYDPKYQFELEFRVTNRRVKPVFEVV